MYSFNYLDKIKKQITEKIYHERMQFNFVYEIVEKYTAEHAKKNYVIIGGSMGIDLLLKKERSIEDFYYELYAENAFLHANNLSNLIDENNSEMLTFLKTTIPNIKYQIFVNGRNIITFYKLPQQSYDLITPVLVETFDKKNKVLVISPEIQLIDIYRTLYSPNRADDWENSYYDENKLSQYLQNRITHGKIGAEDKPLADTLIKVSQDDRKLIELQILKQFVKNNSNVILIGEHALKIIINSEVNTSIIQIISQNSLEEDFAEIEKIIKQTLKRHLPIVKTTKDLHIMQDFRIRRTTIKVGDPEVGQKEI